MTKATKILGLIGRAVDYSYSPLIHNTACRLLGLPYHYTIFNIADPCMIGDAIRGAKALGIAGFNVTIPYKKTVVPFLDELSGEAASIQAVNTIVNDKGKLTGHNTDIAGFASPLLPYRESITGKTVSIFGAGGAALAAIEAFNRFFSPKEILLFVRDPEKAQSLFEGSGDDKRAPVTIVRSETPEKIRECRVVVNATPIGTRGRNNDAQRSIIPLDRELLHSGQIVYDMVYNPLETPLLQTAKQAGATTVSGIEMLIGQAEHSFALWTGMQMPVTAVRELLLQEIQQQ
ncbi:MAG: shikimate dehydrogenase [Chlorobium sp.]|jgi:shikimate dehydrogenase|nr:shikimate dehydrogenase [Chlorobium sp.]